MLLLNITLRNFRSHRSSHFTLKNGFNLITGPNGIGKTNILDAIHYTALSRSFRTHRDDHGLRTGADHFEVKATYQQPSGREKQVRVAFVPDQPKRIDINGVKLDRLTDIIGAFPVVVFSPDDYQITAGGPEERRKFVDNLLCQSSPSYLTALLRYRRALKQRNALLAQRTPIDRTVQRASIYAWTNELATHGAEIMGQRSTLTDQFGIYLEEAYQQVADHVEHPAIVYAPNPTFNTGADDQRFDKNLTVDDLKTQLLETYEGRLQQDLDQRRTTRGPHRDDLHFYMNEQPVRQFASQGQHRTFGLALKLAQRAYTETKTDQVPLLLLDDAFDSLDPERTEAFITYLTAASAGQTIATTAHPRGFERLFPDPDGRHQNIHLHCDGPEGELGAILT